MITKTVTREFYILEDLIHYLHKTMEKEQNSKVT
jgi:hypothetical protein